jgi:hypothetical protein
MIPAAFQPFLDEAPLCVLARVVLERLFLPERLDQLFRATAQRQYERELLFSQVAELMLAVVLQTHPSVHAAYKKRADQLPVSDQAIYEKLRCMELGVSAALVSDSAQQVGPVIEQLGATLPPWLPGYRTRVIDGNHLSATQRRLKALRQTWAAALPGKVLAVYDQERDVVSDVFLTPDGHAQERALLGAVLPRVRENDLWIADRNFCTLKFLTGIITAKAAFVIRQHGSLVGQLVGDRRYVGRSPTGEVYEQEVTFAHEGQILRLRRVSVVLDKPTRDGDKEIHILTNLPAAVDGIVIAALYQKRWTIEGRFYEMAQTLDCEPNTLAYPKAALFAFCLGLVASNAAALLRAALRSVPGPAAVAEMSSCYVADEVRQTYRGMMVALPPSAWEVFHPLDVAGWARLLQRIAGHVKPGAYRKARRGPKKPRPPRAQYRNGGHVSTCRLLEQQKKRQLK